MKNASRNLTNPETTRTYTCKLITNTTADWRWTNRTLAMSADCVSELTGILFYFFASQRLPVQRLILLERRQLLAELVASGSVQMPVDIHGTQLRTARHVHGTNGSTRHESHIRQHRRGSKQLVNERHDQCDRGAYVSRRI